MSTEDGGIKIVDAYGLLFCISEGDTARAAIPPYGGRENLPLPLVATTD